MNITPLNPSDRQAWEVLARGYKDFYQRPTSHEEYEATWQRLLSDDRIVGLGAHVDGELVGIAHYLFHTAIWAANNCYLQDLFTAPEMRGKGVARALILAVADEARKMNVDRFYWMTHGSNQSARLLYDKVAKHRGFIRYDFPI